MTKTVESSLKREPTLVLSTPRNNDDGPLKEVPSSKVQKVEQKALDEKQAKKANDLPGPVSFLHKVFALEEKGRELLERPVRCAFQKPTKEAIEAYDLQAVNAIRQGSVQKLRDLVHQGKSLDACNRYGESLLHMACRIGNVAIIRFLIHEARVDLSVTDDYGRTPMHDACWTSSPNLEVMDLLIRAFSPETLVTEDVRGHSPFHYARKQHWSEWVAFLEERQDLIRQRLVQSTTS